MSEDTDPSRAELLLAMHEALVILGFTHDGDDNPAELIASMGERAFVDVFLDEVRIAQADYTEAVSLLPGGKLPEHPLPSSELSD